MTAPTSRPPAYPEPAPYSHNFLRRIRRGLSSWLGFLTDVDFRIPLGSVQFLGLNLFLVNQPAAVRRLMVEEVEAYPKHPFTLWLLQPLIGRAIFSVNGEEWAQQRRLVDQAFQVAQLQRVFFRMREACDASLARLAPLADGRRVAIDEEMTLVTADVIVRTILSRPLAAAEAAGIFEAFARYQRRAGRALVLRLLRLPEPLLARYLAPDATAIRDWIRAVVQERLHQPMAAKQNDLLQALLEARDPETGKGFELEQLVDQVCFLFLAGHETSASSLGLATYLLSLDPDAQARIRAEVQQVLSRCDRPLDFEDLRQLPYTAAVFNETLRLYPPVSFFIREACQESQLVDRRCPMASLLAISPWVIQRHEQHWPDPHRFRPERFLGSEQSPEDRRLAREAFLPFGLGPRKCPGAAFALQEAVLILAELVRRYDIYPDAEQPPDLAARLTLRSRNGIRVRLQPQTPGPVLP